MGGFIFFIVVFFIVIPAIKSSFKRESVTKNSRASTDYIKKQADMYDADLNKPDRFSTTHDQRERTRNRRRRAIEILAKAQQSKTAQNVMDQFGHSDARKSSHDRLHSQDGDAAFPKGHQGNVARRDARDRVKRAKMEKSIHGAKNFGIRRAQNKSMSSWGAKGDRDFFSANVVFFIFVLAVIAFVANGQGVL